MLEPDLGLMEKNLPGHGLTKVEKYWCKEMRTEGDVYDLKYYAYICLE